MESKPRMFPIQSQRGAKPHPLLIPWSVAELAYSVYSANYGRGQTLERLAERGGFGPGEMDMFLPDWRERCSEIGSLEAVRRVMTERLWFPRFIGDDDGKQRWAVYSWHGLCNLKDTMPVSMSTDPWERPALVFDDPITALIETDKWYREVVEPRNERMSRGLSAVEPLT